MFDGYDPNRLPPYTHETLISINDKIYKVIYIVSNGPAGSISISSMTQLIS